jgi:hypoxia up-regulated 1
MEAARRRAGGGRRGRRGGEANRNFLKLVAAALFALAALLSAVPTARAALLAIDFGSENLKMCLVKPGRTPISIVVNEFSRRKSPSLVGVIAGDRVVGEEGVTMAVKRPLEVFMRTRDLLGRRADDPFLKQMIDAHLLPYTIAPHPRRGGAAAVVAPPGALDPSSSSSSSSDPQLLLPPEELVASVLQYAREAAEIYAGGGKDGGGGGGKGAAGGAGGHSGGKASSDRVVDAVIAVPAWWGLEQRRALSDAASLAGLNLLAIINGHSAAALQYGIERDFSSSSSSGGGKGGDGNGGGEQLVLLFDVGASSTEAALVRFSAYQEGKGSSAKSINQFEVLDVEWDASAGANDLDAFLMRQLAADFDGKHPPSSEGGGDGGNNKGASGVLSFPKAVAKLRRQVRRTKEILSANAAAPFSAEELHNGVDFSTTVSREQLETLADPWFARVAAVAERLLARQAVKPDQLSAVELLGGGSRVPGLQAALSKALGGRQLDRHLDADEAIALGAGLFAANLSSTFRLRRFGMSDAAPYGVEFESLDLELPEAGGAPGAAAGGASSGGDPGAPEVSAEEAAEAAVKGESSDAEGGSGGGGGSGASKTSGVVRALLPPGKRLPARRAVKFHNVTADGFTFALRYNASSPRGLPPGVVAVATAEDAAAGAENDDPLLLARFSVSGISKAVERYGHSGTTVLRFEADHGGRVDLAGAECVVERDEQEQAEVVDDVAWQAAVAEATAEAAKRAEEDEAKLKKEEEAVKEKETKEVKDEAAAKPEKEEEEEDGSKEKKKKKEKAPPTTTTTPRNLTAEYVSAAIANLTRPMKNVTFTRTRTYRVALDVSPALATAAEGKGEGAAAASTGSKAKKATAAALHHAAAWARPSLLGEALDEARATVATWRERELRKRESAKARNDLEAHVIATREALGEEGGGGEDGEREEGGGGGGEDGDGGSYSSSSSSPLRRASTPAERATLREALLDAEDWLYSDEGGHAAADALRERLAALKKLSSAADARAAELSARPLRVAEARAFLSSAREQVASWPATKAWIAASEAQKAGQALDALDKWLGQQEALQAKKKDSEAAAFLAADVAAKLSEAEAAFKVVADKPKPLEKKKKKEEKGEKETKEEGGKEDEAKKEEEGGSKESKQDGGDGGAAAAGAGGGGGDKTEL